DNAAKSVASPDSEHELAAIDVNDLPGHVATTVAAQIQAGGGDVFGSTGLLDRESLGSAPFSPGVAPPAAGAPSGPTGRCRRRRTGSCAGNRRAPPRRPRAVAGRPPGRGPRRT